MDAQVCNVSYDLLPFHLFMKPTFIIIFKFTKALGSQSLQPYGLEFLRQKEWPSQGAGFKPFHFHQASDFDNVER